MPSAFSLPLGTKTSGLQNLILSPEHVQYVYGISFQNDFFYIDQEIINGSKVEIHIKWRGFEIP